jgi:hypothetical protein
MQAKYPGIKDGLLDDKGEVRRFVNVYVNEEDIRFLQNQAPPQRWRRDQHHPGDCGGITGPEGLRTLAGGSAPRFGIRFHRLP